MMRLVAGNEGEEEFNLNYYMHRQWLHVRWVIDMTIQEFDLPE